MTEQPNFEKRKRIKEEHLAKAVEAWNSIGIQSPGDVKYTLEEALNQPYLMVDSYRLEDGRYVFPRLYQNDSNPENFKLFSNGGDVAVLIDIMEKLLQKGIRVTDIMPGHGHFKSMNKEEVNKKAEELKLKYLK